MIGVFNTVEENRRRGEHRVQLSPHLIYHLQELSFLNDRLGVAGIADDNGSTCAQHLATVFRQRLGVTPSVYRREQTS